MRGLELECLISQKTLGNSARAQVAFAKEFDFKKCTYNKSRTGEVESPDFVANLIFQ